jgi:hypothetical protein
VRRQTLARRRKGDLQNAPPPTLDAIEQSAALEAGAEAAHFLETCGTTDLAHFTDVQWVEFCRRFVIGFEQTMRRAILEKTS